MVFDHETVVRLVMQMSCGETLKFIGQDGVCDLRKRWSTTNSRMAIFSDLGLHVFLDKILAF